MAKILDTALTARRMDEMIYFKDWNNRKGVNGEDDDKPCEFEDHPNKDSTNDKDGLISRLMHTIDNWRGDIVGYNLEVEVHLYETLANLVIQYARFERHFEGYFPHMPQMPLSSFDGGYFLYGHKHGPCPISLEEDDRFEFYWYLNGKPVEKFYSFSSNGSILSIVDIGCKGMVILRRSWRRNGKRRWIENFLDEITTGIDWSYNDSKAEFYRAPKDTNGRITFNLNCRVIIDQNANLVILDE